MTNMTLLQKIKKGEFRNQYIIYNRKSTDEENNQKNSISYQNHENQKYADRNGFSIAELTLEGFCQNGVISERHSGFKESKDLEISTDGKVLFQIERPKFQRLVHFLSKGYFKGMICLCWDRMSRNKADNVVMQKLMNQGIDVQFAFAQYDNTSSGALHMDIDGMFSQHHSRVTSEKVRLATRKARKEGICTYRAPIGYLNKGKMEHKPLDPKRAPIIKKIFEKYSTGRYSLSDMVHYAAEQGLQTLPMRRARTKQELLSDKEIILPKVSRPISSTHISKILKNQFYIGKVRGVDGVFVPSSSHKALVSEELFNTVQNILLKKKVSIYHPKKRDLSFRGMIRCFECQRIYTPYEKKGITYLRSKCKVPCSNKQKNMNVEQVLSLIQTELGNLYLSQNRRDQLNESAEKQLQSLEKKRQSIQDEIKQRKQKIKQKLDYLIDNRLDLLSTGTYNPDGYADEKKKLVSQLEKCELDFDILEQSIANTVQEVEKISELLESLIFYYKNANSARKEEIVRNMFSELYISNMSLNYSLNSDFNALISTSFNNGEPKGGVSEFIDTVKKQKTKRKVVEGLKKLINSLKN